MSDHREVIQRRRALFRFRPRPKSGRFRPESMAGINRIQWPLSPGIAGRFRPDYAPKFKHFQIGWNLRHLKQNSFNSDAISKSSFVDINLPYLSC